MSEVSTAADERTRLASALAAHVERVRWLGLARAPRPPAPVAPAAGAPARPAAAAETARGSAALAPGGGAAGAHGPAAASGGSAASGGAPASGGARTSGGATASGGARASGGSTASGGAPASGGATDASAVVRANRALAAACPDLASLAAAVAGCRACPLCETRTQTVFSDGTGRARVLFVGEAPGEHEDLQGVPFVGRAGELLTDIITKGMGLARADVAIANVLKCRPPGNRDPAPLEKERCTPFLDRQIELLDPRVIVTLGLHASRHVLGGEDSMGRLRGRVHERAGRKVVATYHPAYLLRSPERKKDCWQDIQLAMRELGLAAPTARAGTPHADENGRASG